MFPHQKDLPQLQTLQGIAPCTQLHREGTCPLALHKLQSIHSHTPHVPLRARSYFIPFLWEPMSWLSLLNLLFHNPLCFIFQNWLQLSSDANCCLPFSWLLRTSRLTTVPLFQGDEKQETSKQTCVGYHFETLDPNALFSEQPG